MPRSTYHGLRERDWEEDPGDETGEAVRESFEASSGRYGTRRVKRALARRGITASRRRIGRSMDRQGPGSCHCDARSEPHAGRPNEAGVPNVPGREFDGHAPHTHVRGDPAYVRVGAVWCYACLLIDLHDREIVGHAASASKDAALVMAAFATVAFPLTDIKIFHTDRGGEFDNRSIDEMLEVFGITRSLSKKGCPFDNAVDESTNKTPEKEMVYRETFRDLEDLRRKPDDYVWWHDNERLHSTLNYMSPVEFRLAGMSLSK